MSASTYDQLRLHIGHQVEVACYGRPDQPRNVAVECLNCMEVLYDRDGPQTIRSGPDPEDRVPACYDC